jgi:hypothetical protein
VTTPVPLPAYSAWLERVASTVDAVSYTCRVRLGSATAGDAIALRVAAGLVSRPMVFRYWGLPYSGRIAKLAEAGIASARAGTLGPPGSWPRLREALEQLPPDQQQVMVWTCVEGWSDDEVAAAHGCDAERAAALRADVLARLHAIVARSAEVPAEVPADEPAEVPAE